MQEDIKDLVEKITSIDNEIKLLQEDRKTALEDFKGKIDGALDKVSQLNGYYYTENAKAEEFGYNNKAMQVGVSAQEVKAVLPEVVSAAPFDLDEKGESKSGENYMTVNYEKLVPLLIEAIKELKAEVEALKAAK